MSSTEYIKIAIAGIFAITIISSVFSFLINVESINVMPDANEMFIDGWWRSWSVKGGISCLPNAYTSSMVNAFWADYSYCNSVADDMHNTLTSDHDEWRCELYTDYSDKPFFESFIFAFPSFKIYFIILVTSVLFYGIFSVIHDWTLVKYKKRLNHISFLPDNQADHFRFIWFNGMSIPSRYFDRNVDTCKWALCTFIAILFIPIFLILDLLYLLIIWPLIAMIQSSQQTHKIPTISYISAQWVGISCFMMGIATSQQMHFISTGFPFEIPSLNPSKCTCFCNYIFHEYDYYKLLFITFIFILLTINFLYSWTMEAIFFHDNNYFLYLIKFLIPIKQAHKINSNEVTGSMLNPLEACVNANQSTIINIENDEKQPLITEEEKSMNGSVDDLVDDHVDESGEAHGQGKVISGFLRVFIFFVNFFYLYVVILLILLNGMVNNFYHYPKWGRIIGYIFCPIIYMSITFIWIKLMIHFGMVTLTREKFMAEWNRSEANENDSDNVDEELLSNQ